MDKPNLYHKLQEKLPFRLIPAFICLIVYCAFYYAPRPAGRNLLGAEICRHSYEKIDAILRQNPQYLNRKASRRKNRPERQRVPCSFGFAA